MTFASDQLANIAAIRAIPGQLGLRPHAVAIVERTYTGDHTGDGTYSETATPLTESGQNPKVHWLSAEKRAISGLPDGAMLVGPITPAFTGGGTDLTALLGSDLSRGETLHLRITGPMHPTGALYRITHVLAEKAMHYTIHAQPVG